MAQFPPIFTDKELAQITTDRQQSIQPYQTDVHLPPLYEGGSRYDVGILPFMDQADYRNYNQGFWSLLGNGLGRLAGETVTDAVQGVYQTLALPAALSMGQQVFEDDPISLLFNDVHDYLGHNLPAYHATGYENLNFAQRLSKGDFWSDDFVQGLAFMGAAALTAYAGGEIMGAEAGAAGVARTLGARLGGSLSKLTAEEMASLGEQGLKTRFGQYLINNSNKIGDFAQKATFATLNRTLESTFEASQTYEQVRDAKYKVLTDKGMSPEQAKVESEEAGSKAAAADFYLNYLALPADYFEAGLIFKGIHQSEEAGSFLINALKNPNKYKQTLGRLFQSGLGDFTKGAAKGALWEGVYEENMQQAIQNWTQHKYVDNSKEDVFNGIVGGMVKNFSDVQGGLNIGLGALQGALFGGAGKTISNRQERKLASGRAELIQKTFNDLNSSLLLPSAKNLFQKDKDGNIVTDAEGNPQIDKDAMDQFKKDLNALSDLERNKNVSALKGDKIRYNLFKNLQVAQIALNYFNAGIGDELISKLGEYAKMKPEDIQKLGISYLEEDQNGKQLSPAQIATKYQSYVKELQGMYNSLENSLPQLEDDPVEDRNHRAAIFLNAASQIALRQTVQEATFKKLQLETEQQLGPDGVMTIQHRVNNLADQHDLIDAFIDEKKQTNSLDTNYEKVLRNRQKDLIKQIEDGNKLRDPNAPAIMNLKADLQKHDYANAFMNELDASNSLHEAINDYNDYTDPKKWKVKREELAKEQEKQFKAARKKAEEDLDKEISNVTADENDRSSLTKALQQYESLKDSISFNHKPLEDLIEKTKQRITTLDSKEKTKKNAESARKAQPTEPVGEKKEAPKPGGVTTTATLPEVVNPNHHTEPEDKERLYTKSRLNRKKPAEQRDVSNAFSFDERVADGAKAEDKKASGDIHIVPSTDPFVTSQKPTLSPKLNVGDKLTVEVELNNPTINPADYTEMNFSIIIKTLKGERIRYYNKYQVIKGLVCLNLKHWDLLAKQHEGMALTVEEQEDLDFFNKRLERVRDDRKYAWAQYKKTGKINIDVKIVSKSHGNTINQNDNLNGNPTYQQEFNPRLLTQVFDEFELVLYTQIGELGFTSDGVATLPKKMTPGLEYTQGATYALVNAPATDPLSTFESRYPVRLLHTRLGKIEFGAQAVEAIYQRMSVFKELNDGLTPQEVDELLGNVNQITYTQASGLGKNPERVNMIIDAHNTDKDGQWRPRISIKVNDNSYVIFFFRQLTGEKASLGQLFTGFQFNTIDEAKYDRKTFEGQYGIDKAITGDELFKKLLGNRFFNINIREFSNKKFKLNLLPDVDFADYKKSLVTHGIVKTDLAKIVYADGTTFPGFYNPEIQMSPFGEAKPTPAEVLTPEVKKEAVIEEKPATVEVEVKKQEALSQRERLLKESKELDEQINKNKDDKTPCP